MHSELRAGPASTPAELSLSAWGRWDDNLPPALLTELQLAYARELIVALSVAFGPNSGYKHAASGKRYREVTPEEVLRMGLG